MTILHHLALGARDVRALADFYRDVFELDEVCEHRREDGSLRSVWLKLESGVLMIEHLETQGAPKRHEGIAPGVFLLAFGVSEQDLPRYEARLEERGLSIESRTKHTVYARDPEENRVALSTYPLFGSPRPE